MQNDVLLIRLQQRYCNFNEKKYNKFIKRWHIEKHNLHNVSKRKFRLKSINTKLYNSNIGGTYREKVGVCMTMRRKQKRRNLQGRMIDVTHIYTDTIDNIHGLFSNQPFIGEYNDHFFNGKSLMMEFNRKDKIQWLIHPHRYHKKTHYKTYTHELSCVDVMSVWLLINDKRYSHYIYTKKYEQISILPRQSTVDKLSPLILSAKSKQELAKVKQQIFNAEKIVKRTYHDHEYLDKVHGTRIKGFFTYHPDIFYWKYKTTIRPNNQIGVTSHDGETNETFYKEHNISDFIKEYDVSFGENHTLLMDEETTMLFKMLYV